MAPVLINKESGLAEDIPQDQADASLAQGSHEVPLLDPQGNTVTASPDDARDLVGQGYSQPSAEHLQGLLTQAKHSGVIEQGKTALEGAAEGVLGPVAPFLEETALNVKPEDIRGREEANPGLHKLGQAGGFLGSIATGFGEGKLLSEAGEAAQAMTGLGGEGAGVVSRMGAAAARGAAEMGLMQAGDEASKFIKEDPNQSAETAVANIGLSALLGAGLSAPFGAISPLWGATKGLEAEQALQDYKNGISGTVIGPEEKEAEEALKQGNYFSKLSRPKANADEIVQAAQENNWPVLEGMTSGSKEVQMAEDALLNGPPSLAAIGRSDLYNKAYEAASNSLDSTISAGTQPLSETQAGDALKESLQGKLDQAYKPLKDLYAEIDPYRQAIPVSDKSLSAISRNIMKIAEEKGIPAGTDRYNFLKNFSEGLVSNDNLQKIANFRTEVGKAAGPLNKDLAQAIVEKLDGVEERSIKGMADTMKTPEAREKILSLLDKADQARSGYAQFREKLQTLGNSLGKKKIYGPQNFQDFLEDLNPQSLVRRLFNENNTTFAKYFAEEFPEEMGLMRGYQRNLIREGAIKEGLFNPKSAIKAIGSMEPEMRDLLFSKEEQGLVKNAETYLCSFPKSFNPSGTAHESAFRAFFEHPTGALAGNIRDFAIERFIKAAGHAGAESSGALGKVLSVLSGPAAQQEASGPGLKSAVDFITSAVKGETALNTAVKAVFIKGLDPFKDRALTDNKRKKLDERLDEIAKNPDSLMDTAGQTGHYLPNHAANLSATAARAVQTLAPLKPDTQKKSPLDPERKPTKAEQAQYDRALELAEKPTAALQHIKDGTLTIQDVKTLRSIYPNLYDRLTQKLTQQMIEHVNKGGSIPYKTRMSLALFLNSPLDSSLTPACIQSAQMALSPSAAPSQEPQAGVPHPKHSMNALNKLPQAYRTPAQAREMDKVGQ